MSCCLIDKPLRLMQDRAQDRLTDSRINNNEICPTCKELGLSYDACKFEEDCTTECLGEELRISKSQAW